MAGIGRLKRLKVLDVRNNDIGDEGMRHISQLSALCDLSCSKNSLTDACAPFLALLQNLTYLDITNNTLTQESSHHLTKL